jgi:hypothetical protein
MIGLTGIIALAGLALGFALIVLIVVWLRQENSRRPGA